jgi:hypothetical protein
MSVTDKSNLVNKDTSSERELLDRSITEEGSNTVKKVELEIETESEKDDVSIPPLENEVGKRTCSDVFSYVSFPFSYINFNFP